MEIVIDKTKKTQEDIAKSAMDQLQALKAPAQKEAEPEKGVTKVIPAPPPEPKPLDKAPVEPKDDHRDKGAEKRIKELTREKKEAEERLQKEREELSERLKALEAQNIELQKKVGIAPEDKRADRVSAILEEKIHTYMEEDKAKPKHERREMSEEEFDEWMTEDFKAATRWEVDRRMRRREEEQELRGTVKREELARSIVDEQKKSQLRVEARHPELNLNPVKAKLKAEGKSEKEIHETLLSENPKYKAVFEIIKDDPEFYQEVMVDPKGPELLEKAMLRRLEGPKEDATVTALKAKIEELEAMVSAEGLRRQNIDGTVISRQKGSAMTKEKQRTSADEFVDKEISKLYKLGLGFNREKYDKAVERRKTIPGANYGGRDDE